jgi:hemerythrin superfamily protein
MQIAEKIQSMAGVTPTHSNDEREQIRQEAKSQAKTKWFKAILEHHQQIENLFDELKNAHDASARNSLQKELMALLTGHSIAEEAIVYPFMKIETSSMDATHAYAEQSLAKVKMVELDSIKNKMGKEYDDKVEEIRKAVTHHMIEEERDFFPELQEKSDASINKKISDHYEMEFERYSL